MGFVQIPEVAGKTSIHGHIYGCWRLRLVTLAAVSIYFVLKRIPRREKSCILKSGTLSLAGNQMEAPCLQELLWLLSAKGSCSAGQIALAGAWALPVESPRHFWRVRLQEYLAELFLLRAIPKIMALVRTPRRWLSDSHPLTPLRLWSHQAILRSPQVPSLLDLLACSSLSPVYREKPLGLTREPSQVSFSQHISPREEN